MSNPKGGYQIVHGMSDTRTYYVWKLMRQRCSKPTDKDFHNYGARGITVCDRWQDFRNFLADMGEKPEGYSIERVDNNKGYSPDNCKWIPMSQQARNRRMVRYLTIDGITHNLSDWCRHFGIKPCRAFQRLHWGWSEYDAVSKPLGPYPRRHL